MMKLEENIFTKNNLDQYPEILKDNEIKKYQKALLSKVVL
jgi:hypothetical protein